VDLQAVITSPARQLSPGATEYVRLRITPAGRDPSPLPDLSRAPVAVASRPVEQAQDLASPQQQHWVAVAWEDTGPDYATVAVLTGPNGGVLNPGPGRHYLWAEIVAPPEVIVIRAAGFLTVA
jgi:hypothetical protein